MSIFSDPVMDPREAECEGHYLYGAGFFASEDQQLGILRGERTEASFCNDCPARNRCWEKHRARTREALPEEVEDFERLVAQAASKGISGGLVAATLQRAGKPEPYMQVALANYRQGAEHRRRRDGSAITPRSS